MNRFQKDIVFFKEEKYRESDYGTVFYVAGTNSSALNEFVRQNASRIESDLNADDTNWVTCRFVYLGEGNRLFGSGQEASLYSAMLPTADESSERYGFVRESLAQCMREEAEDAIASYFALLQELFDEILDTGYYRPDHFRPVSEKRVLKLCLSAGGSVLRRSKAVQPASDECMCVPCYSADLEESVHYDSPSRLEITPNTYHVLLPDYEREIHFTAQVKALYVLFLNHPEGIRMKEISDYKEEYKQLYFQLTNRSDADKLRVSVERLLDVCNPNALNVKKSQCNSAIYRAIPESELRHYYEIEVNRSQPHKINLDRALVSMPSDLQKQSL